MSQTRYFYTNTGPVGEYPNYKGFVSAQFKGDATTLHTGEAVDFVVFGIAQTFAAEDGSGIQQALERQWGYQVGSITKLPGGRGFAVGIQKLPKETRVLNYLGSEE